MWNAVRLWSMVCVAPLACASLAVSLEAPLPSALAKSADANPPAKRPLWKTSKVAGRPEPPPPFRAVRAFPKLNYNRSLFMDREPGSNALLVMELNGRITAFPNDDSIAKAEEVYLLADHETYSFRFDPEYPKVPRIYVFANGPKSPDGKTIRNRIFRYAVDRGPLPRVRMKSQETIIEWFSNGHNGGEMDFGPDGMLYISSGDGTSDSDRNNTGQDLSDLCSAILRIDVNHPDPGRLYSVPKDNPFIGAKGACPEIWAFGLRNPWRMSFDKKTGDLWIGDIGQDLWEMIRIGRRGANYGWAVFEGSNAFHAKRKLGPGPVVPPEIELSHSEARSITGGIVYRGARFPELRDRYLFGDYSTGKVWAALYRSGKIQSNEEIADTRCQILAFCEGPTGEIYLVDYSGSIHRLERQQKETPVAFPRKLSETGIFADVSKHLVDPGLVPYDVNSPLWSDGAAKMRFIGLPGDAKITYVENESWTLPHGTVLVKTFSLNQSTPDGVKPRRIETRLLVNDRNEWYGYTYRWNDAQTDGDLVDKRGQEVAYPVVGAVDNKAQQQTWRFPSRTECMVCHSRAARFVLGLSTIQLNRPCPDNAEPSAKGVNNQLRWLESLEVFSSKLPKPPEQCDKLPSPYDSRADRTNRVRSYLHVNCSICHIEAGGGNSAIEISYKTPPDQMRAIGVRPLHDAFDIKDALLVAPGAPERSVLLNRISHRGRGKMPPLASAVVDREAVKLIEDWIRSLPAASSTKPANGR